MTQTYFRSSAWFGSLILCILRIHAVGIPSVLFPGTTNGPGPLIQSRSVQLSWQPVAEATRYRVSVRDLTRGILRVVEVAAPKTNASIRVPVGVEFRWNMRAFAGSNESEFSETLYFRVPPEVRPKIYMVAPNPLPAIDGTQPLTIYGDNFVTGCTVTLRDEGSNFERSGMKPIISRVNLLSVMPNLTRAEAEWSVEVVNPGDLPSGRYYFRTVLPIKLRNSEQSGGGWKWIVAVLALASASLIGGFIWKAKIARGYMAERIAAARKERDLLCRDLHDGVSGSLSMIAQSIDQSRILIDQRMDSHKFSAPLNRIRMALTNAQYAIEDILWLARPENEELRALVGRLRVRVCERLRSQGIECQPNFPMPVPDILIAGSIAKMLLQIVNECLNNIEKHAQATKVIVALAATRDELRLTIADNGRGFSSESENHSGRGLQNLKNRAEEVGGVLLILAELGEGTEIQLTVPLENQERRHPPQPGISAKISSA